jgi:hypothetical protein
VSDELTIYESDPDATIQLLAELDSTRCPRGRVLVAAVGGQPRAAVPLDGGPPIADPFHRTAELVSLLTLRAAQLDSGSSPGSHRRLATALGRRRSRLAGLEPVAHAQL